MEDEFVTEPEGKVKTSKMAIVSFVLMVAGFFSIFWIPRISMVLWIAAIIFSVIALIKIKKNKDVLKGRGLAITSLGIQSVLLSIYVVCIFLLSFDAPPIPDDYTVADLRSAGPEYVESYELLLSLADPEGADPNAAPAIGLSREDVKAIDELYDIIKKGKFSTFVIVDTVVENKDKIELIWEKAKRGRTVIDKLSGFEEIADLTEPDIDASLSFLNNLKSLAKLYHLYICLENNRGNSKIVIAELGKLNSVFRKLSLNARNLITKLICMTGSSVTIWSANFIANNPETSPESLEVLAGDFKPLTRQETSLRNSFISDYLMFRKELRVIIPRLSLWKKLGTKENSTLRVYRNYCNHLIAVVAGEGLKQSKERKLSVWPDFYIGFPEVSYDQDFEGVLMPGFPWYYACYNAYGSSFVAIMLPVIDKIVKINTKLKIRDDLLQVVLNKRLGREVSLKARAYSDEYMIDTEKKIIFSPGPDGEAYTKDDIKLAINPEVLGIAVE